MSGLMDLPGYETQGQSARVFTRRSRVVKGLIPHESASPSHLSGSSQFGSILVANREVYAVFTGLSGQ